MVQSVGNHQDDDNQAFAWLVLRGGSPEGIGRALHELTSPWLHPAAARIDDPVCKMVYELKPIADGVETTLHVTALSLNARMAKSLKSAFAAILNSLYAIVETGQPGLAIRLVYFAINVL